MKKQIILLLMPIVLSASVLAVEFSVIRQWLSFALIYPIILVIPSYLFSKILFNSEKLSFFEHAVIGYPVTFALMIILQWLGLLFETIMFNYGIFTISIIGIFLILMYSKMDKENNSIENIFYNYSIPITYFFAIVFLFILLIITIELPSPTNEGVFYQDNLWTIGNTFSILKGKLPLERLRFSGIPFGYHMGHNLFIAYLSNITRIEPIYLHLHIYPYFHWFFIVSLVIVGGRRFAGLSRKQIIILAGILFFTAPSLSALSSSYRDHLFNNQASFFYNFPFYIIIIYLIIRYINTNRLNVLYTALVFLLLFSTKASLLFVFPVFLTGLLIIQALRKRLSRNVFQLAAALLLIVVLLKLTIYSTIGGSVLSLNSFTPEHNSIFTKVVSILQIELPKFVESILFFFYLNLRHLKASLLTIYFVPFVVLIILSSRFRVYCHNRRIFIFLFVLWALISSLFISIFDFGSNHRYFTFYTVLMSGFLSMFVLDFLLGKTRRPYEKIAAVLLIIISIGVGIMYHHSKWIDSVWWRAAVKNDIWDQRAAISYGEWEGLRWINNNLPDEAVVISDRRSFSHKDDPHKIVNLFFGYSTFSGKQFYTEGDGFMGHVDYDNINIVENRWDSIYKLQKASSSHEVKVLLERIDANYYIESLRFNNLNHDFFSHGRVIFDNGSMIIYELAK